MKSITVVAEDRVGLLADISYILGSSHINIESLSVIVQSTTSMVNITVKDEKRATDLLRKNGFKVLESEMLLVKIKNEPTQMAAFTAKLSSNKISIVSMHPLAKQGGYDTFALKVDHIAKAKRVLSTYLVELGSEKSHAI
ncbi:MAG: ACT domain-containing protein [Candidatus Micrarchaeota archaeon]|nr:ACT domain-containing protein [Candidatus Micrarchaeota archaeon]